MAKVSISVNNGHNGVNNDPSSAVNSANSTLRARDFWHIYRGNWLRIRELLTKDTAMIGLPISATRSSRAALLLAATYTTRRPHALCGQPAPMAPKGCG